jgi:carboxypeptidase Q
MTWNGVAVRVMVVAAMAILHAAPTAQNQSDAPDLKMYARIRDEGQARTRVMDYATELMDGIGARLTGSPGMKRATAWAIERFSEMELSNVRAESWGEFGMGWQQKNVWLRLLEPDSAPLIAHAAPWSPATSGLVTAEVIAIPGFIDDKQLEPYRGRLKGKVVLFGRAAGVPEASPITKPLFERLDDQQLADWVRQPAISPPDSGTANDEQLFAQIELLERSGRLLAAEGVAAVITPGSNGAGTASGGTILVDNNAGFGLRTHRKDHAIPLPFVITTVEHYGRMKRLLDRNVTVRAELNVDTAFTGDHEEGLNVLAEIAGVDPRQKDEIVMVAAHLDSWAAGTGATDNGAGVVIAMEAMRILRALQVKPRRTIRVALWSGEEQGALGSLGYVTRHVARIPTATTAAQLRIPEFIRRQDGALAPLREHALISAVYNVDGGAGRFRGIAAGHAALVPVFTPWIAPLKDLGVEVVAARGVCAGDCRPFARAGIPTPAFIQDPLEYATRTHHTNMDTLERLIPDDLRQAAIVMATVLYNTAMRTAMLPRSN